MSICFAGIFHYYNNKDLSESRLNNIAQIFRPGQKIKKNIKWNVGSNENVLEMNFYQSPKRKHRLCSKQSKQWQKVNEYNSGRITNRFHKTDVEESTTLLSSCSGSTSLSMWWLLVFMLWSNKYHWSWKNLENQTKNHKTCLAIHMQLNNFLIDTFLRKCKYFHSQKQTKYCCILFQRKTTILKAARE